MFTQVHHLATLSRAAADGIDPAALFPVDLLVKDVHLALQAASSHGLAMPLAWCAPARHAWLRCADEATSTTPRSRD